MSNKLQKHLPLIFVVTLAIVLASVMTFSIAGIATADTAKSPVDKLEIIVDKEMWPMPSYGDLIFEV